MKEVYINRFLIIGDILLDYMKFRGDVFKYMVECILMWFWDIFDFFNRCIEKLNGKIKILWSVINSVEKEYSEGWM